MAHVRSKEATKTGTCFLSFTHTKNKIYGSTALQFYNPENGDVIVDLAKVPKELIIDLHSYDAVAKIFGITSTNSSMNWSNRNENQELYDLNAAARDTVRTREILIMGDVPEDAVVAIRHPKTTKNQWVSTKGVAVILPSSVPANWSEAT